MASAAPVAASASASAAVDGAEEVEALDVPMEDVSGERERVTVHTCLYTSIT